MLQHHFCMWTITWEMVMSGVTGLKSMFLIQTKMLDRQNHIKWGWQVPQKPSPSPCWSFPTMLNYLHLKTYKKYSPALQWCPFWRIHIRACASPWYHCEPMAWTVPWLGRKLPAWWPGHRVVHPAAQTHHQPGLNARTKDQYKEWRWLNLEPDLSQISTTQYSVWICCSGHVLFWFISDFLT